jgi:TrmH family RNA methyltransferase
MLPPITSRDNPRVKAMRALRERRGRHEQGAYLIEGVTLLLDALAAGARPLLVLRDDTRLSADHRAALDVALARHAEIVQPLGPAAFRAIAETESPQGVAAVLPLPPAATLPAPGPRDLVLIADGLQDPGNLGAMLRAAEGAGVRCVATTPGTVDLFNPKVVRAGMGAHFRLRLAAEVPWPRIVEAIGGRLPLLGADTAARRAYDAIDWRRGGALVVGNEAGGLSEAARSAVEDLVSIPLQEPVESLNAAVAAAVILFEAARQRRAEATPARGDR